MFYKENYLKPNSDPYTIQTPVGVSGLINFIIIQRNYYIKGKL